MVAHLEWRTQELLYEEISNNIAWDTEEWYEEEANNSQRIFT